MPKENQKLKEKNWEARYFKKLFGFELNTPISGRIVAEERGLGDSLDFYDSTVKELKKYCPKCRKKLMRWIYKWRIK